MIPMQCVDATIVRAAAAGYEFAGTPITVTLPSSINRSHNSGTPSTAISVQLSTNGPITISATGASPTSEGNWLVDISGLPGDATNYEAKADITASEFNDGAATGTFGTWLELSSSPTWGVIAQRLAPGEPGASYVTFTLQVREKAPNNVNTDSVSVSFFASTSA